MEDSIMSILLIGLVASVVFFLAKAADGAGFDSELEAQRRWSRWYED